MTMLLDRHGNLRVEVGPAIGVVVTDLQDAAQFSALARLRRSAARDRILIVHINSLTRPVDDILIIELRGGYSPAQQYRHGDIRAVVRVQRVHGRAPPRRLLGASRESGNQAEHGYNGDV